LVAVVFFLPDRAQDLSAPLVMDNFTMKNKEIKNPAGI
jgi:hypothetical protein